MNTKILFSKVYNRKNQLNSEGKAPIEICAYLNGKRRYFSTKIFIRPQEWDNKRKQIKNTNQTAVKNNKIISELVERLENAEFAAMQNGQLSLTILDSANRQTDKNDFLAFVSRQIAEKKDCARHTINGYKQLLKNLNQYKSRVSFSDLTYSFIDGFNKYLISKGFKPNSANGNLRMLRAMINSAINNGLIELNAYPFRNFHIKRVQTERAHLTAEEIERIEQLTIENPTLAAVRDMYLFSVYTGLRHSDIIRLTAANVVSTGNKTFLTLTMQKTARPLTIPLHALFNGKPIAILKKYETADRPTFFPPHDNGYTNKLLKEIANRADIKKRITFHTARHTAATYLLNKGVNIVIVQKILGHTELATTEIYAKMLSTTIEKELENVNYSAK